MSESTTPTATAINRVTSVGLAVLLGFGVVELAAAFALTGTARRIVVP